MESVERFTGLANVYAKSRPTYPAEALDFIISSCSLTSNSLVLDLGCGTGIFTRLLAERKLNIIGVEPNEDMIKQALSAGGTEADSSTAYATVTAGTPTYIQGTAEDSGLPDGQAQAIVCAQSFHWFQAEKALEEMKRLLTPCGYAALIWNERDEEDTFTREYGELMRTAPDTRSVEMHRGIAGQALLHSQLFQETTLTYFGNEQVMDEEGLLGRLFSTSYAPREESLRAQFAESARQICQRHQKNGLVAMKYKTSVYLGRACI